MIHCVVNGELYDYENIRACLEANGSTFKTGSDSELVVHAYVKYFSALGTCLILVPRQVQAIWRGSLPVP